MRGSSKLWSLRILKTLNIRARYPRDPDGHHNSDKLPRACMRITKRNADLGRVLRCCWVAVKELNLSYHIGETLLFTIYTHYGNLI